MQQDNIFISQSDILSLDDGLANEIMAKVKENYVEKHHPYAISYLENKGYWKTYIGSPRKGVTRRTKEDLISYLYSYYKNEENTVEEVFEQTKIYRRDVLNRSQDTIFKDQGVYNRFVPASLSNMKISEVDEDFLDKHFADTVKKHHPTDKALKGYKSLLNSIFEYACQKKLIERNPVKWINLENYFKDCDLKQKSYNERIFTNAGNIWSKVRVYLCR